MNPGLQPTDNLRNTAANVGKIPAGIVKPVTWLGRLAPINPGKRQTLNLILLAVVLPVLLLSLALANFLNSLDSTSADAGNPSTEQIDLALERILETRATTLASIAADSTIKSSAGKTESVSDRLEQFHRAHSEFESLALVKANGAVEATAGILHQDFYLWQNTPAFHDSLNNRGRPTISPLKFGVLSVAEDGSVDLSPSRIERLIFTAVIPDSGLEGRANGLVVGIMQSNSLMDSAYTLLRQDHNGLTGGQVVLKLSQEDLNSQQSNSDIQLLSLTPGELAGVPAESGVPDSQQPDFSAPSSTAITPFQDAESSWYSVFPSASPQQTGRTNVDSLTIGLATLAVSIMLVAGWVIIKSPKASELQPSVDLPGYPQMATGASTTGLVGSGPEISQRLVAVQESVRRQMADYLHGHVQSKLLALSMSLGACQELVANDPDHACQMMEEIQGQLRKVQDEDLRQISHELYPAIIKMGLVPAMRSLASRFEELLEIDLIIDADIFALDSDGESGLPEKQRLGVYRIAEEALNNILKHAKAKHVEVTLICQERNSLVMTVVDNGRGFDIEDMSNCQGLALMTDYAEAISGYTQISSTPGQGTTIKLSLNINPQASISSTSVSDDEL